MLSCLLDRNPRKLKFLLHNTLRQWRLHHFSTSKAKACHKYQSTAWSKYVKFHWAVCTRHLKSLKTVLNYELPCQLSAHAIDVKLLMVNLHRILHQTPREQTASYGNTMHTSTQSQTGLLSKSPDSNWNVQF